MTSPGTRFRRQSRRKLRVKEKERSELATVGHSSPSSTISTLRSRTRESESTTMKFVLLPFFLALSLAKAEVITLNSENFDSFVAGKNVFIKFYAPWCGHCNAMAPAWEQLAADYEKSKTTLIAEVDCTAEQEICQNFEVQGYPTLIAGNVGEFEDYQGGRDYDSLKEYAEENLTEPICSVHDTSTCSEEEKGVIAALEKKTARKLREIVSEYEKEEEEAEAIFQAELERIEEQYDNLVAAHAEKLHKIKKEKSYTHVLALLSKKETVEATEF